MSIMSKSVVTIIVTTAIVSALAYFFGFPALFAHTMSEVFWYAMLYGGANVLALGVVWLTNKDELDVSEAKRISTAANKKAAAARSNAAAV